MTPQLPPGFVLDSAPALPPGFVLDGAQPSAPMTRAEAAKDPRVQSAFMRELKTSPPMAVARGLKDVVDTGALGLAMLYDKVTGADALTLSSLVTGQKPGEAAKVSAANAAGRAEFDANAEGRIVPQFGRFMGNMAAVSPIIRGAGAAIAPVAPRLGAAVATGGMTTGAAPVGAAARAADMGIRSAGGTIGGFAGAGAVDPDSAQTGGVIGAVLPPALQVLGAAGKAVGSTLRGPAQSPQLAAAVQDARQAGYVIPPTQAKPTLVNRVLEGFSGKITTAQNASAKNQAVTNRLAAESLGLPGETQLTTEVLDKVRADAGKAYAALEALPKRPAVAANTLTNQPAVPALDPKAAVFDLRKARNDATAWFRSYGRTADPDSLAKAQSAAAQAKRLETDLEQYATGLNKPELVDALRDARTLIAKTYTVENALNVASGSVNARKLAADLQKGKPLSGGLKQAASFADQFPKAAQVVEGMGSLPQTSPLDWALSGSLSAMTANPLMMAGVAARPLARASVLSGPVQNRLVQQPRGAMANALMDPEIQRLLLRGAPLTAADR